MQPNTGIIDRTIRAFMGMGLFAIGAFSGIGWLFALCAILGTVLIVMSLVGFCPFYVVINKYKPVKPVLTPAEQRHGVTLKKSHKQGALNTTARIAGRQGSDIRFANRSETAEQRHARLETAEQRHARLETADARRAKHRESYSPDED
jgi:hypothetical protein